MTPDGTFTPGMGGPPRRRGLGRGLDALLASSDPTRDLGSGPAIVEVDPHRVHPNPEQPRRDFDPASLATLADSIRHHGLIHPIVVEPDVDGYRLVAGERRLRAARQAGVAAVPAILRPASESGRHALELALTENLQREDLNPMEEAAAYARLSDAFGLSHEAIALRLGRTRPTVTNAIRLLQLPANLQDAVASRALTPGHARVLLSLGEEEGMSRVARQVVTDGLTVRATEALVQRELAVGGKAPRRHVAATSARRSAEDEMLRHGLEAAIGLPVTIERTPRGGRVVITFSDDEDLDTLYRRLGGRPL